MTNVEDEKFAVNASRKLADFTAGLTYKDLSASTVRKAKQCLLDWLGVAIRGSEETPARLLRSVVLKPGEGNATVFCAERTQTNALCAAFMNGAASHTLDFDDLHNPSIIHVATVVAPPVFAIAEAEHKSGREMLSAAVAGWEIAGRVGECVNPESYFFWHTTGTAGSIGGGAAAANLLGLDNRQTLMALGTVGTQTAGLWEFVREGAMSKPLHTGKGCYAAVLSAYLARVGFTGASQILEGPKGFCRAMLASPHWEKLTGGLPPVDAGGRYIYRGYHFKLDDNSFKPYPCCKHSHAALYALQQLKQEYGLMPEKVARLELLVNGVTDGLINNPAPQTVYGGKFSLQYCCAAMLADGKVDLDSFTPSALRRNSVRELMSRTVMRQDSSVQAIYDADNSKLASKVVVHTIDGLTLEKVVEYPFGDPQTPMTWQDSCAKFRALVVPVYGKTVTETLIALMAELDEVNDFSSELEQALKGRQAISLRAQNNFANGAR